ncbi:cytochrome P450 monooxygenase [Aspergillus luchuensis]|uniref:Cytochrome P450 monooxygenase n=1 Tax=Aspergillus kawachii TaxID=1069201 RepID=A0A146FRH5_ASPKA|nr:cytochrome P450 monooxygenase [Aspergillus luchuensis]
MVGMLENKAHGEQKRLLSGIYAKSYLLRSGDIKILGREMVVRRLGEFLKGVVAKGAVFNVLPVFQAVGMDFTSGFVFGAQGGTRFLEDLASWGVWLGQYEAFKSLSREDRHTEEMEKKLPPLADIDALPLLDAIVRETLRRHAPAPAPLSRVTPPEGAWIHGYYIPGGVQVSSSAYSLHRIEEVFPSPEEWIPMRWMDAKDDKIHDMRRLFYPFGTGGRMCLGNNFAFLEIKLVIAMVYANYLPEVVDDEDIEQHLEFIALPKGRKLMVRFVPVEGNTV